jgi:hypothetical protein
MKGIGAYLKNDKVYLHPILSTNSGGVFIPPVSVENIDVDNKTLGESLVKTLELSRRGDFPKRSRNVNEALKPLFEATHTNSYSDFVDGNKHVSIALNDSEFTFLPSRNNGHCKGFGFLWEKHFKLRAEANNEEIGLALKRAFELSE